jgi:hypothetical protein
VFAILGGVTILGLLGTLALLGPIRPVLEVASAGLVIRAVWWHLRRPRPFTLDRRLVQASRKYAGAGWIGVSYFGWILGTTLFTQMATPLVQVLACMSATLGVPFGLAAGLGLGLGRSFEPWLGALARTDRDTAQIVEYYLHYCEAAAFRIAAFATAAALLAADLALAVR